MQLTSEVVFELVRRAHTSLPEDVLEELKKAHESEKSKLPKLQLKNILENVKAASSHGIPICQDTGVHTFFIYGKDMNLKAIEEQVQEGLEQAVKEIPLRPNSVDPLSRIQQQSNAMIHFIPSLQSEAYYLPKGAGSENMSRSEMMLPGDSNSVTSLIIETVQKAGANPCPPIVLGIGIGGSLDYSSFLAKKALLKPITKNTGQESEILEKVNQLRQEQ